MRSRVPVRDILSRTEISNVKRKGTTGYLDSHSVPSIEAMCARSKVDF